MDQNKQFQRISFWATIAIIFLAVVGAFYIFYSISTFTPTNQEDAPKAILNDKVYEELSKPKDYGAPISTDEAGYGRPNPFAPYK